MSVPNHENQHAPERRICATDSRHSPSIPFVAGRSAERLSAEGPRAESSAARRPLAGIFSDGILLLLSLSMSIALGACATKPPLIAHDNPARYTVARDIQWAAPDGFALTMDIYTPTSDQPAYPVLMIFHGGGWLLNDNSIMDQAAAYIATNADYVVCNVNYRLLADQENTVTMDQIVEDAFGAVLWAQANISRYRGDPSRLAVTGDSAGGHLSAMIVNSGDKLDSRGYSEDTKAFNPSYLPPGITADQIAADGGIEVQAAILSYGGFDLYRTSLDGYEGWTNPFWLLAGVRPRGLFGDGFDAATHPELYKGVSPLYNIAARHQRAFPPQLLTAGSEDLLVTPASVQEYRRQLEAAGHPTVYWEYEGRNHAFLDSGSSLLLGSSFDHDAPEALNVMIKFLDQTFAQQQAAGRQSHPETLHPTSGPSE
ncbi:MAG: alpha/beta hydrolase [Candidatus Binatia bacterium]|nr:alpha/beta hydrolase [Candidatus Binatia bacterium]